MGNQKDIDTLVAERARLILPKLIEYMDKKEKKLSKLADKTLNPGAGKLALVTYDDLIMTRAAVDAILTGKHEAGMMRILGLWEESNLGNGGKVIG